MSRLDLQRLGPEHAAGVLAFEVANRDYFVRSISDRGEAFFERFDELFAELVAEQDVTGAFYVLVEDGRVIGRFNLNFREDRSADLGYRMAEEAVGRGLATAAVRQLCATAHAEHGLDRLVAAVSATNVASQRVLVNAGFVLVGRADPASIGGREGTRYERELSPARRSG